MKSFAIKALGLFALSLTLHVAGVLLLALPFKWLWNASLTPVFLISRLTYLQSVGLIGLVAIVRLVVVGGEINMKLIEHDT
jgi:hypothetical protein